ncbi:unnamed protein product [Camellia sinensis]
MWVVTSLLRLYVLGIRGYGFNRLVFCKRFFSNSLPLKNNLTFIL